MQTVLDRPMASHDIAELRCIRRATRQVVGALDGGLPSRRALTLHHHDRAQSLPRALRIEPFDLVTRPNTSHFDAPMSAIGRLVRRMGCVAPSALLCIREELRHLGVQGRMIVLESQHVVRSPVDDRRRDRFLTPHRIDRDRRAAEIEKREEPWDRDDLVALVLDRNLRQSERVLGDPCAHQAEARGRLRTSRVRSCHRLPPACRSGRRRARTSIRARSVETLRRRAPQTRAETCPRKERRRAAPRTS